jgi:hypothetical protein
LIEEVKDFTEYKNGVYGGHNYDEFLKYFQDNEKNVSSNNALTNYQRYCLTKDQNGNPIINKIIPNDINGIFEIEYKVIKYNLYNAGVNAHKVTGTSSIIPKKSYYKKTVYDPNIISNDEIIEFGKKAIINGMLEGNTEYIKSQNKLHIIGNVDTEYGVITFEGYRTIDSNYIESFYPIIP